LAAWATLEAQPAISALQGGKRPADSELVQGIAGLRRAIGWAVSARRLTDLALLEVEQADRLPEGESANRQRLLVSAEKNLLAGLAANPSNGFAWLRLALVREQLQAPPRSIVEAVLQSVDMSPNMRKLWPPRASLMLAYWRQFRPDEMPILRAQLRTMWSSHEAFRRQLVQAARQTGQTLLLLWAIGDSPVRRSLQRRARAGRGCQIRSNPWQAPRCDVQGIRGSASLYSSL
jgi:hypothetical protein